MSFTLLGILNAQAAAAGGAGAYDLLETTVLTSSASSVSFTGLGSYSDYKHLQIRTANRHSATSNTAFITFNNDSGSNYAKHFLLGTGSSVASNASTSETSSAAFLTMPSSGQTNAFSGSVIDILDFSSTSKNTTIRSLSGYHSELSSNLIGLLSGLYISTSAITEINLSVGSDFITGSRFSLYGLKG